MDAQKWVLRFLLDLEINNLCPLIMKNRMCLPWLFSKSIDKGDEARLYS